MTIGGSGAPRARGNETYDITAVLPFYFPETTGHCQSCNSLFPYLAARGMKVAVITCNRMYSNAAAKLENFERHEGVDVRRFSIPGMGRDTRAGQIAYALLFNLQAVRSLLFTRTRKVICITSPPFLFSLLALVCRLKGVPLVLWAMDLYPEVLVEAGLIGRGGVVHRLTSRLAVASYRRCSRIFTLGPVMSQRMQEQGIPARKLTAVHNWVPESISRVSREANGLVGELGLQDRFVVEYSGNMGLSHSLDILLAAAKRLLTEMPRVMFLMIGSGPERRSVENEVKRSGLTNVKVLDYMPFARLSESLSLSDVGIVSLGRGMGGIVAPGKIYAYLKVGSPVVLVQDGESDLSRILNDGIEGRIVRPDDAGALVKYILELLKDPERVRRAREKNAAWYRNACSLESNASAFLEDASGGARK